MGFSFGGFAGGLASGLQGGEGMYDKRMQRRAMKAWGNTLSSIGQAPPPLGGQQNGAAMGAPPVPDGGIQSRPLPPTGQLGMQGGGYGGAAAPGVNTQGLNAGFADRLQDLQQDAGDQGVNSTMISGYRSPQQQAALYADRGNNSNPVAPPGQSMHNYGMAADVQASTPGGQQQLASMAREPWRGLTPGANFNDPNHFQAAGGRPQGAPPQGMPPGAPQQAGQPQQPQGAPQQGGMPTGPFNMQQVAMAIKKANPNASPQVIAMAMQNALPFMNAESQQQYKQFNEQLRMQQLDLNRQKETDTNQYRDQKVQQGWERIKQSAGTGMQRLEQGQQRIDALKAQREQTKDYQQQKLIDDQIKIARENKTTTVNALANLLKQVGPDGSSDPAIKAEIDMLKADLARYNQPDAAPSTPSPKASGGSTTPSKPRNEDAAPAGGEDKAARLEQARQALRDKAPKKNVEDQLRKMGIDPAELGPDG